MPEPEAPESLPLAGVAAVQLLRRTPDRHGRILLIGAQGGVGAHLAARLLDTRVSMELDGTTR